MFMMIITPPQLKEQAKVYPVVRLMVRDYLPIPASTCLAERSFSMSARTDYSGVVKWGERSLVPYRGSEVHIVMGGSLQ
jgi:hypothetical protein